VGPSNLPEKTLPGFLRVNRARVRDALQWLKKNNPLYQNIDICKERLNDLPIDNVPTEISCLTWHLQDEHLLAEETDGYIPEEDDEGLPGVLFHMVWELGHQIFYGN
jgi:hypothetical protein